VLVGIQRPRLAAGSCRSWDKRAFPFIYFEHSISLLVVNYFALAEYLQSPVQPSCGPSSSVFHHCGRGVGRGSQDEMWRWATLNRMRASHFSTFSSTTKSGDDPMPQTEGILVVS
jgi:hypothetical protein